MANTVRFRTAMEFTLPPGAERSEAMLALVDRLIRVARDLDNFADEPDVAGDASDLADAVEHLEGLAAMGRRARASAHNRGDDATGADDHGKE